MNHFYRVIWSNVKNSYVVVAEIVKNSAKKRSGKKGVSAALFLTVLMLTASTAGAENFTVGTGTTTGANSISTNSDAILLVGSGNAVSTTTGANLIGTDNTIKNRPHTNAADTIIGHGNVADDNDPWPDLTQTVTVIGNNNKLASASTGIVIGDNQTLGAPRDTIVIGSMNADEAADAAVKEAGQGGDSVVIGYHAHSRGINGGGMNVVVGDRSKADGWQETVTGIKSVVEGGDYSTDGYLASVYGALNQVASGGSQTDFDGTANSIVGAVNKTENANGAVIMGAGNKVTHSYGKSVLAADGSGLPMGWYWQGNLSLGQYYALDKDNISYDDLLSTMGTYLSTSGGSVVALGNGNTSDYAVDSQLIGAGNVVSGTADRTSFNNTITGYANKGVNINHVSVVGTGNTLSASSSDVVIGDYHEMSGGKNNVVIGSMASKETTVTKHYTITVKNNDTGEIIPEDIPYTVTETVPVKGHAVNVNNTVMIGYNADATGDNSIAIGTNAQTVQGHPMSPVRGIATGASAVAIGSAATAAGYSSVSVGNEVGKGSSGYYNFAFGSESGQNLSGEENVSIGRWANNNTKTSQNIAIGLNALNGAEDLANAPKVISDFYASGGNSAIGSGALQGLRGSSNVALGTRAGWGMRGSGNIILGTVAGSSAGVNADNTPLSNSIIMGTQAGNHTGGNMDVILGNFQNNNVVASNVVAVGSNSIISKQFGLGIGHGIMNDAEYGLAVGSYNKLASTAKKSGVFGIGTDDGVTTISGAGSYAVGNDNTIASDDGFSVGNNNPISGHEGNTAIGSGNTIEQGTKDILFGDNHKLAGTTSHNIVLGSSDSGTALNGINETVSIGHNSAATDNQAIAIGTGAQATGAKSISIGTGNTVSGSGSGAIGDPSLVSGSGSYAVGNNNTVTTDNTFVFGNNVTNTTASSVFLGDGSAYVAKDITTEGSDKTYTHDTISGKTLRFAGGDDVVGVVSVGSATQTRRIQNVAPGLISSASTDAVNGSQLYAVAAALNNSITAVNNETMTFTGDTGRVDRKLGTAITVTGDANITTKATESGIQVNLNKTIDLGTDGSIKTGNTVINTEGITSKSVRVGATAVTSEGMTVTGGPTVTKTAVDMAGQQIQKGRTMPATRER